MLRAIAAALLALAAFAAADASAGQAPALRVLDRSPLSVRGSQFVPRERVRVTVSGDAAAARTVRAGVGGGFVVTFSAVTITRCDLVRVAAIGRSGDRAVFKFLPPPMCTPD